MTSTKPRPKLPPNAKLRAAREALDFSRAKLARKLEAQARVMRINFGCDVTKLKRWEEWGMKPKDYALEVLEASSPSTATPLSISAWNPNRDRCVRLTNRRLPLRQGMLPLPSPCWRTTR